VVEGLGAWEALGEVDEGNAEAGAVREVEFV